MKQKNLLLILASLFILTILWVMFTIYHNFTTSTIEDPLSIQIIPINGTFDLKTLNALKKRQTIEPVYEFTGQASESLAPSPTPVASNSGTENLNQGSASQSSQTQNDLGNIQTQQ